MTKKALITGITGQDGSYLAELLIEKGYEVYGVVRRSSSFNFKRIAHLLPMQDKEKDKIQVLYGDLTDQSVLSKIIRFVQPDEIYNLGAQSHVKISFDIPEYTINTVGMGTVRILESIKEINPAIKFYQASSSEMYGNALQVPQNEHTHFNPISPYACGKVLAHQITKTYRSAYGIFACGGILFNHESPRRGENFVSKKITQAVARIKTGKQKELFLGNIEAKRDWGYAPDYVDAMWRMLQQEKPDDYVIATGETHTVKEFVETAFDYAGLNWKDYVKIDQKYYRPAEVNILQGDYAKAKLKLGWEPKIKFKQLVKIMVDSDIAENI